MERKKQTIKRLLVIVLILLLLLVAVVVVLLTATNKPGKTEESASKVEQETFDQTENKQQAGSATKEQEKTENKEKQTGEAATEPAAKPAKEKSKFIDHFDGPALNNRWYWVRELPTMWSLEDRPGTLMIKIQPGDLYQNMNNNKNLLLMNPEAVDFQIDVKLEANPLANYQQAGIVVYKNDDNYIRLTFLFSDNKKIEMMKERHASIKKIQKSISAKKVIFLRLIKKGDSYQGYFSDDGVKFALIGNFTNALGDEVKVGLVAFSSISGNIIPAYFEFFQLLEN